MKYGLIGNRLKHSFSKIIHETLADYEYELIEVDLEEFHDFMVRKDFKAINVTIPYKEKVFPYIDVVSEQAKRIGTINTVINKDGILFGYNTDYDGLKALINKAMINIKDKKVLILGTGGTSKTASAVIEDMGCKEYHFVSRTKTKKTITYVEAICEYNNYNIIINTTPCGMYPNNYELAIDISNFSELEAVIDVIYNPLRTKLVIKALEDNKLAIGGLYMLVAQAFYASNLFQNKKLNDKLIDKIYDDLIMQKENIVLIGMPSSGKTTIGKILAKRLNKNFIDTDDCIKNEINMEISEYFTKYNECSFRKVESKIIEQISKETNLVIATGGGVILDKVNMDMLKENGRVIFINRKLDSLTPTDDRPLAANKEMLKKVYFERKKLYENLCDLMIDNDNDLEKVVDAIVERIGV